MRKKIKDIGRKNAYIFILMASISTEIVIFITNYVFTGYFRPNENVFLKNSLIIVGAIAGGLFDSKINIRNLEKNILFIIVLSILTDIVLLISNHIENMFEILGFFLSFLIILITTEAVKVLASLFPILNYKKIGGPLTLIITLFFASINVFSILTQLDLVDSTMLFNLFIYTILLILKIDVKRENDQFNFSVDSKYYIKDMIFILFLTYIFVLGTGIFHIYILKASLNTTIFYLLMGIPFGVILWKVESDSNKSVVLNIALIFEILFTFIALNKLGNTIFFLGMDLWTISALGHKFLLSLITIASIFLLTNLKTYITDDKFIPVIWSFTLSTIVLFQMAIKITHSYYLIPLIMIASRGFYLLLIPILIVTSYITFSTKPEIDFFALITHGGLPLFYLPEEDTSIKISNFVSVIQNYISERLKQKLVSFVLDDKNVIISYGKNIIGVVYSKSPLKNASRNLKILIDIFEKKYDVETVSVIDFVEYDVTELVRHFFILNNSFFNE